VERLTGMKLLDFLKLRLAELEFSKESYMLADPEGVSMGGTGLVATPMDVLKFGYLLLKEGRLNGKQLVPASYIREATSCLTETAACAPLPSEACGYGYMIWQNEKGGYVLYGMGGQLVAVFPNEQLIFVTTADTQGIAGGNQLIYDAFYRNIYEPLRQKQETAYSFQAAAALQTRLSELSLAPLHCFANGKKWLHSSEIAKTVNRNTYRLCSVHPAAKDGKEAIRDFTDMTFLFKETGDGELHFTLHDIPCCLSFAFGRLSEGIFPIYNLHYASSAVWFDERTLYIRFHIIDAYTGSVLMQFYFGDEDLTVYMKKNEESCFGEFQGHFYGTLERKSSSVERNL
jgi:hypothetical protein